MQIIIIFACLLIVPYAIWRLAKLAWRWMRIIDRFRDRAARDASREIGASLTACADCMRGDEDAAMMVRAVGSLLESGHAITGAQLRFEYFRLKGSTK